MCGKRAAINLFARTSTFFIVTAVVISILLLITTLSMSSADAVEGDAATLAGIAVSDRVSDPNTSDQMGFIDVPRVHDGRIWTDKSVDVGLGSDDFTVTFSALSQSFPITEGFSIPADTVFVIDVSGSMTTRDQAGGPTRIAILIEALNEAICILQDANPDNRIAVVAYGGRSQGFGRVENVLSLGRYTAESGEFFSVSGTTVSVNAVPAAGDSGGSALVASLQVAGSTPTQWGIHYGSLMLEGADTSVTVPVTDDTGTIVDAEVVTRRPNIILMTDGEPTMAWTNYTFEDLPANPLTPDPLGAQLISADPPAVFVGDGSYGEIGVSLLTVLTAAHQQQQVFNHYFPTGWATGQASGQPLPNVGFFTIGLGVQPSQAATDLIRATMDPGNYAAAVDSNIRAGMSLPSGYTNNPFVAGYNPSMGTLINDFVGGSASFNVQRRQAFGTYNWDFALGNPAALTTIANAEGLTAADLDFADLFFEATNLDELREAFLSITTGIQVQSNDAVTNVETSPDFDGWLVFSDVLGEYMQFRGGLALSFDDVHYSRAGFDLRDAAIRSSYESILLEHMNYGLPAGDPLLLSAGDITQLIDANLSQGNYSKVVYYADQNRNFISATNPADAAAKVEAFPMMGELDAPVIPGGQTDLMYITFRVVTALQTTTFNEIFTPPVGPAGAQAPTTRNLNQGEQLVRWYIPASLIPQRSVDSITGEVSGNTMPVRISFTVGLDTDAVASGVSADYRSVNSASDGSLYFFTNGWRDNQNVSLVFDIPHKNNPFYNDGRPGYGDGRGTVLKSTNPTGTAQHVSFDRSFIYNDMHVNLHWMGNNGRLTLKESGELMLTKGFGFDGTSSMQVPDDVTFIEPIRFTIVVPTGDDIALNFPDDFSWVSAQGRYELKTTVDLPIGTYTVVKTGGEIEGDDWIYLPQPGSSTVTITTGQVANLNFINEYFPHLPEDHLPALRVRKIFHDLDAILLPDDFFILIVGPEPIDDEAVKPNDHPDWTINDDTNRYELVVGLQEALESVALRELTIGEYLIAEVNFEVDAMNFVRTAWLVREATDRYPMFGDETDDPSSPLITVNLEEGDDTIVRLDNFYEKDNVPDDDEPSEPPTDTVTTLPPTPPGEADAPKTGDMRQAALFIALLALGMICAASGIYWYKKDWIHGKLFRTSN